MTQAEKIAEEWTEDILISTPEQIAKLVRAIAERTRKEIAKRLKTATPGNIFAPVIELIADNLDGVKWEDEES